MSGDTEDGIINKINQNINTIKEINKETRGVLIRTLNAIDEKDTEIKEKEKITAICDQFQANLKA